MPLFGHTQRRAAQPLQRLSEGVVLSELRSCFGAWRICQPRTISSSLQTKVTRSSVPGTGIISTWRGLSYYGRTKPSFRITGKNEAACAADASREVVERWLPKG